MNKNYNNICDGKTLKFVYVNTYLVFTKNLDKKKIIFF